MFKCARRIRVSVWIISPAKDFKVGGRAYSMSVIDIGGVGTQQMRVDIAHRGFLALSFARAHRRGRRCDCVRTWAEMRSSV